MRLVLITFAFALLLPLVAAAQESLVWVDPAIGQLKPDDLTYLAAIKGRPRTVDVRLHQLGATATARQQVTVIGALTKAQVAALLQSVLGADRAYWQSVLHADKEYPIRIAVGGDEHRAAVLTTYGKRLNYLYTYERDRWRCLYLYRDNQRLFDWLMLQELLLSMPQQGPN
jgi:hypothetical protein